MERIMKVRSLFLIGLSVVLGLAATKLLDMRSKAAAPPTVKIVTAKAGLGFGDKLTPENLRVMNFPADTAMEGSFSQIEDLTRADEPRVALRPIAAGEPVLASKISGTGGKATLSTVVEKDMRAITIRVNDVTGGGGFVLPQDRVDVLLTRTDPNQKETIILLQNIKVLAVDQQADEDKNKPIVAKAVTLEVTPDDAQKLTLGSSVGSLSLALRNYANPESLPPRPVVSVNDLFGLAPPPKATERPRRRSENPAVQILRGTESASYDVLKDQTHIHRAGTVAKSHADRMDPGATYAAAP
jgi:pilus assembly protein CpaB